MRHALYPFGIGLVFAVLPFATFYSPTENGAAAQQPFTIKDLADLPLVSEPRLISNETGVVYVNDVSGAPELWYRPAGGLPVQLTFLNEAVSDPRVSPDGSAVVFGSDFGGNERYDIFRFDLKTKMTRPLTATKDVSETAQQFSPDGTLLAFEADPDIQFRPQIYVMDLATGKRRQLTKGAVPAYHPVWSPDGKLIAATRTGDDQNGDLLVISIGDDAITVVKPPADGYIISPVAFLSDTRALLAQTKNREGYEQLALVDLTTGGVDRIGPQQWDVVEAVWNDKSGAFFTRNVSGRYSLWRMRSTHDQPEEIIAARGVISGLDISRDGARLAFTREDATQPADIYVYDIASKRLGQLTRSLPARVDSTLLSPAEPFKVKSFDGANIEGLFFRPRGARFGPPYPAVAHIHGGPNWQSLEHFDCFVQALTQAGFAVVEPNYRGSTGYGKAFEDLNNKDWGGGDRKDVRAVLEHFIEVGLIDRQRLGITGGSYGGYMTLIALVKDPDFYRAGADSYGMFDLVEDYNLTKDRFGLWYETEMGTPQTDAALFADRSPIRFLDRVKAPLIVFQGANDTNVPRNESDKIVEALRKLGRKVDYVVYPDEGHGFTRRPNRIDNMQRTVDFFRQILVDSPAGR